MKRYLIKLLLFFTLLFVFYLFIPRYLYETPEYYFWKRVFDYVHDISNNGLKTNKHINVVIGDSRSQVGLNAKYLNSVNLSLGGSTPFEGYYVIKKIVSEKNISVDTLYVSYGLTDVYGQIGFYPRSVYFGFVDNDYLHKAIYGNVDPLYNLKSADNFFAYSMEVFNNITISRGLTNFKDFLFFGLSNMVITIKNPSYMANNQIEQGYLKLNQKRLGQPSDVVFLETEDINNNRHDFSPLNISYLDSINNISNRNNIKVFYVLMPIPETPVKPEQSYYSHFDSVIAKRFTVIRPYYTLKDSFFVEDQPHKTYAHLSRVGNDFFSKEVSKIVRGK